MGNLWEIEGRNIILAAIISNPLVTDGNGQWNIGQSGITYYDYGKYD